MPKCTVFFDDGISEQEIDQLIQAIELLRGVDYVESDMLDSSSYQPPRVTTVLPKDTYQSAPPIPDVTPDPTKLFIDEVIRWAVKANKLRLAEVKTWSPEEILGHAIRLFDTMPENQKARLGKVVQQATE